MSGQARVEVPFRAHVELLQRFVVQRAEIVESIQGLLNAQRKPAEYLQDRALLSRELADCFFTLPAIGGDAARLGDQLEQAHWACGFRPRRMPGIPNDLVDPADMMMRGFHFWQQTRWPGRNARLRYAHTLFTLFVLRRLALLTMRLWDAGEDGAHDRLAQLQGVLDRLCRSAPADQPRFVRDVRWLIPVAQSPTTDELSPYFDVARAVAESLPDADRIEIHKASVDMAGGHLRSQLLHCSTDRGVPLEEHGLVLSTRNSNALDFAMLIQGLVPLLHAYEHAARGGDNHKRLELAGALCQGISADPELFVNRLDLLGPYSMIEHLFVAQDDQGHVAYTPTGERHVQLLEEYTALIHRLAAPLAEDCPRFRPVSGTYSPFGVIYGFSSNLLEHMALKTLQPDAATHFGIEDVFADEEGSPEKLAWVSGWRKLPHIKPEVQRLFAYPQPFAEQIFGRIETALRKCAVEGATTPKMRSGKLWIASEDGQTADAEAPPIPDLPTQYIFSSDARIVSAQKAHSYDQTRLLRDRKEGMFLVSYETSGGWVALSKDVLTELLGMGRDARVVGLPSGAARTLRLMCPGLAIAR